MPKISRIRIVEPAVPPADLPATLEADLEWVKKRGVDIERLHQDASSPEPLSLFHLLPLVFVDGNMALSGRYPAREEMGIWMMFGFVAPAGENKGGPRSCTL